MGMPSSSVRSAASAPALPRSAVRRLVLACSKELRHTADLASVAAASGRPNHGASYLLATLLELQPQLRRLRRHLSSPAKHLP